MFAALPAAFILAPFTVIVFAAITTQVGALQLAPVAIAVITAYLAVSGSGTLMALATRGRKGSSSSARSPA
jgi:asparagine N-glycosylation enzyme membrane subunit Stt3